MTTDDSDADFRLDLSDLFGATGRDTDYGVLPGTYVKVVVSGHSRFPRDSFVVLYLRPNETFLFLGRSDFERTVMAGRWSVMDESVQLDGFGRVFGCCPDYLGPGHVQRTLKYGMNHSSPVLTAAEELPGWSSLSRAGDYSYLGGETVFDPNRGWLPQTIEDVDKMIEQYLQ